MKTENNQPIISNVKKQLIIIGLAAVISLIVFTILSNIFNIGRIYYISLDDKLTVTVNFANSEVKASNSNYFAPAKLGDEVVIHVPLDKIDKVENQSLCFNTYNAITIVKNCEDGEILYSYGQEAADANKQIGHIQASVDMPDSAWNSGVDIIIYPQESSYTSSINRVFLLPAVDSRLYVLIGNQLDFILYLPILVFSIIAIIGFGLSHLLKYGNVIQGLLLSLFLVGISCWYLGLQGIFYLMSENIPVCANIEYAALYFMMIPFIAYIRREKISKAASRLLLGLEIVFIIIDIAVTVLNHSSLNINYSSFINPFRILLIISLFISIAVLFIYRHRDEDESGKVLRGGLIVTIALGILEAIKFALYSFFDMSHSRILQFYTNLNFTRYMFLVFLITLFTSYIMRALSTLKAETERKQLAKIAYIDILTGIPNRLDVERKATSLKEDEVKKCAIIFFDSNDLKKANDEYGHEVGDALLINTGEALKNAMEGIDGFYGRYGGDEFIACVYDKNNANKVEKRYAKEIENINKQKLLPFDISVAHGIATIDDVTDTNNQIPLINRMIKAADDNMYHNKAAMKNKKN